MTPSRPWPSGARARAFCAGGDIRAVQQAVVAGSDAGAALLRDEYRMNALIGAYPKPYIALMHGIVHGRRRRRVGAWQPPAGRSAALAFAMPETGIGFIPDVGSSYFLSRLPDEIGHVSGPDRRAHRRWAMRWRWAWSPMRVTQRDFDAVIDALARGRGVDKAIAPFVRKAGARPAGAAPPPHRHHLLGRLGGSRSWNGWTATAATLRAATAQTIRARSPTSLKIVFRQLRDAAKLDLKQCLAMEFRLALRVLPGHDFREGVRAALVDKDRAPKWQPSSLAGVGDIDAFFAPLAGRAVLIFVKTVYALFAMCRHTAAVCESVAASQRAHFTRL